MDAPQLFGVGHVFLVLGHILILLLGK